MESWRDNCLKLSEMRRVAIFTKHDQEIFYFPSGYIWIAALQQKSGKAKMVVKPLCFYCQPRYLQSLMCDMKRGFHTSHTVLPTSTQNTTLLKKQQSQFDHSWSFASKYASIWDGAHIKWTSACIIPLWQRHSRGTQVVESKAEHRSPFFMASWLSLEAEETGGGVVHPIYLQPLAAICWTEVAQTHHVCDAIPAP